MIQGRIQKCGLGGGREVGSRPLPPLGSPSPSRPLPSFPIPFPPLPLEVGPLNPAKESGGALISSPSGVWGGAPAEIEFGTF